HATDKPLNGGPHRGFAAHDIEDRHDHARNSHDRGKLPPLPSNAGVGYAHGARKHTATPVWRAFNTTHASTISVAAACNMPSCIDNCKCNAHAPMTRFRRD